jgi:hypothetical protein
MEVEERGYPISVTLIKPGAIDTPFTLNAKNYLESTPKHPPPVYEPQAVAAAILHCAATPVRDVFVGWGGKQQALMGKLAPRLTDLAMEKTVLPDTLSGMPKAPLHDNSLERPSERLTERGNYPGHVKSGSLYTRATLHPYLLMTMLAGAGIAAAAMISGNGRARANGSTSSHRKRIAAASGPKRRSPASRGASAQAHH